jgi:hypothetical protein
MSFWASCAESLGTADEQGRTAARRLRNEQRAEKYFGNRMGVMSKVKSYIVYK